MATMRQFAHTPSGRIAYVEQGRGPAAYFDVEWSYWLAPTIPGTKRRVELAGARIFLPEERSAEFNAELRAFWMESS